ncbi:Uncharacterised protein [Salmonella enterica]|nr:Uncharacterised protein [Salmonella enterica]SUF19848.1 Uncharacterised protein [Salmonella enterica]SUG21207.1 Uncharacterised protein [Salmonella enterica subsp. arizonae]SUG25531.1 Uncharacterised protein [Salmonella enterica subsp. arizonae]
MSQPENCHDAISLLIEGMTRMPLALKKVLRLYLV